MRKKSVLTVTFVVNKILLVSHFLRRAPHIELLNNVTPKIIIYKLDERLKIICKEIKNPIEGLNLPKKR